MNARERQLAILVGGLLALVAGWWLYGTIAGSFDAAEKRVAAVQSDIDKQQRAIDRGRRAGREIAEFEAQSLPSDSTRARALYQAWLYGWLEAARFDEDEVKVEPVSETRRGDVYRRLTFKVSGRGDLNQMADLLWRFYAADHLHKIRQASIAPVDDSRDLDISLTIEALSLPGALHNEQLSEAPSPRLADHEAASYLQPILARNLFAPPSKPPRLASVGTQRVELGSSLRFTAEATDPDPFDALHYSLAEPPLPGATIDARSGAVRWTPKELGEYELAIVVEDSGVPSRSARQTVRIEVVEPAPPSANEPAPKRLAFDNARHAYLTGTIETGAGNWELWLDLRTEGEIQKLHVGDRVSIGSVEGTVSDIGTRHVEIVTAEDERLIVGLGEPLSAALRLPPGGL